jgi:hypothetical protein
MQRRNLLLLAPALALPAPGARAFSLILPEEAAADSAAPEPPPPPRTRSVPNPDAPAIVVAAPDEGRALRAPLSIRLQFVARGGAAIDLSSFRARYGFLGIDVTARLLQHARLTAAGLEADNADIPAGDHRLRLEIADTSGRRAERSIRFVISA